MKSRYIIGFIVVIAVIPLMAIFLLALPAKIEPKTITDPTTLPGMQSSSGPWQPELANLAARLHAIGLPTLGAEGSAMHIHQHLDILIDGKPVAVPAGIGINQAAGFISPIHVHDNSGIIHVESPTVQTFTLGQVFDIWGVKFTAQCMGGYCGSATSSLKVFSEGKQIQGDPRQLSLQQHQEITITFGSDKEIPQILPTYTFPAGY